MQNEQSRTKRRILARIVFAASILIASGIAIFLIFAVLAIADLRSFEWPFIWQLFGPLGIGTAVVGVTLLLLLGWLHWRVVRGNVELLKSRWTIALHVVAGLVFAWIAQWLFLEQPLTQRLVAARLDREQISEVHSRLIATDPHHTEKLVEPGVPPSEAARLRLMAARIAVNRPDFYRHTNIGDAISDAARRYAVEPILLFYWLFQNSFYGEATSGRLPFASQMTSETFRDFVQAHLPTWLIASSFRRELILGSALEKLAGHHLGWKLRYAVHKATLDLSMDPYNANIFSDVFYVMERYPANFLPDLEGNDASALDRALATSFRSLNEELGLDACDPDSAEPADFSQFSEAFKTFTRATFYKLYFDFDFATKVQALLLKVIDDEFQASPAHTRWNALTRSERASIVAMSRDVFVPNVGHPSLVPFTLPEINCAPRDYLREQVASADPRELNSPVFWRPDNPEYLWAGAGYIVRLLNEVWQAAAGESLRDLGTTDAANESLAVIARLERN